MSRVLLCTVAVCLIAVIAASASGYVVILKNGHRIAAREPLQIKDRSAIITLVTGTVTSFPLDQVDLVATERYNKLGLGSAFLIEELGAEAEEAPPTPTPRTPLGDVAEIRLGTQPTLGSARPTPTPTPGIQLRNKPYPNRKVDEAFRQVFDDRHLYLFRASVGTTPDQYFVQCVTDSEREVFQTLKLVAEAYTVIRDLDPDEAPRAIELEMVTSGGKPAGTFRLTPEQARALHAGEIGVEQFYVQHVIF